MPPDTYIPEFDEDELNPDERMDRKSPTLGFDSWYATRFLDSAWHVLLQIVFDK